MNEYSKYQWWRELGKITLYIPVNLISRLHNILANNNQLAEGGSDFWDCFHLIPVSDHFWVKGALRYRVFPVRHHFPGDAFGLALPGRFLFTGDTRPIPEMLVKYASSDETIFHDATVHTNPSGCNPALRACRRARPHCTSDAIRWEKASEHAFGTDQAALLTNVGPELLALGSDKRKQHL